MGGNSSATMIGNMAGPCPRCGSMGIIPDGKYETIKNRLTVILNNVKKVEDLEHLKRVLENSIKKTKSKNAKKKLLKKSPEHAEVWNLLPKDGVDLFLILGAYSTETGHPVQTKPDSQSTGKRTPSPLISDTSVGA